MPWLEIGIAAVLAAAAAAAVTWTLARHRWLADRCQATEQFRKRFYWSVRDIPENKEFVVIGICARLGRWSSPSAVLLAEYWNGPGAVVRVEDIETLEKIREAIKNAWYYPAKITRVGDELQID